MKGFTLVELIIYLAIIATILFLLIGFLWNIVFGNIKATANLEVQENSRFAITKIAQEIRKASGINSPQSGDSPADSLSLAMADPNLNPTIFNVINGKLRITQGGGGTYELTSDQVVVSGLQFTNLSYPETPGTLRVEMTIENFNPENRKEYQASIDLNSTISLVSGGASP